MLKHNKIQYRTKSFSCQSYIKNRSTVDYKCQCKAPLKRNVLKVRFKLLKMTEWEKGAKWRYCCRRVCHFLRLQHRPLLHGHTLRWCHDTVGLRVYSYTVSQKMTLILHTITSIHINLFWWFFGRDVAERVHYRMVICYPTSPN